MTPGLGHRDFSCGTDFRKEKEMKRVVVTGLGAITPIGNGMEEFWNGVWPHYQI